MEGGGGEEDQLFYCTSWQQRLPSEYNIASFDVGAQGQGTTSKNKIITTKYELIVRILQSINDVFFCKGLF